MDKFQIAQSIHLAVSQADGENIICSKGHELCSYFQNNTNEVKGNGRNSYHIGTAMFFYKDYINQNTDSIEYKFTRLVAYVNLYEALSFQDTQSVIGAYRLHILLDKERDFFRTQLMMFLGLSLDKILNADSDEITKKINKLFYSIQYSLFMYCRSSQESFSFEALNANEKKKFSLIYDRFQEQYGISDFNDDETFKTGSKILNELYKELCENHLEQYDFLGILS